MVVGLDRCRPSPIPPSAPAPEAVIICAPVTVPPSPIRAAPDSTLRILSPANSRVVSESVRLAPEAMVRLPLRTWGEPSVVAPRITSTLAITQSPAGIIGNCTDWPDTPPIRMTAAPAPPSLAITSLPLANSGRETGFEPSAFSCQGPTLTVATTWLPSRSVMLTKVSIYCCEVETATVKESLEPQYIVPSP